MIHNITPPAAASVPDMRAICEALGFDPTNHHNAAKCPYCRPAPMPVAAMDVAKLVQDARDSLSEALRAAESSGHPLGGSARNDAAKARDEVLAAIDCLANLPSCSIRDGRCQATGACQELGVCNPLPQAAEPAPSELPENAREWTDSESAAFRQGWAFGRNEGLRVAASPAPAGMVPQWISVEDRLPEPGRYLIASTWGVREASRVSVGGGTWWQDVATRTDEGRYDFDQPGKLRVTHWMPLPASPAPDEKKETK